MFNPLARLGHLLAGRRRPPGVLPDDEQLVRDATAAVRHPAVIPLLRRMRHCAAAGGTQPSPLFLPLFAVLLGYDRADWSHRRALLANAVLYLTDLDRPADVDDADDPRAP